MTYANKSNKIFILQEAVGRTTLPQWTGEVSPTQPPSLVALERRFLCSSRPWLSVPHSSLEPCLRHHLDQLGHGSCHKYPIPPQNPRGPSDTAHATSLDLFFPESLLSLPVQTGQEKDSPGQGRLWGFPWQFPGKFIFPLVWCLTPLEGGCSKLASFHPDCRLTSLILNTLFWGTEIKSTAGFDLQRI